MSIELYTLPAQADRLPEEKQIIALGLFDGLHIGHRAVINRAVLHGVEQNLPCGVYTFLPGTMTTKPNNGHLDTLEGLGRQLDVLGVDRLYSADFRTVRHLSPEEFVRDILQEQLHAAAVVCGFNYRFGRDGAGDLNTLARLCAERGITLLPVEAVEADGEAVSSTRIRRALAEGDTPTAGRLLGRPIALTGSVQHGQGLGHTLGFPTANLALDAAAALPRFGVYAAAVEVDDRLYTGVTNIGCRPTVGGSTPLAETFIEGLQEDLYGHTITVYPVQFLRPEQTFPTLEALRTQVAADREAAHALFHSEGPVQAVLFDYDDTLNPRQSAFRQAITAVLRRCYPTVDEATLAARAEQLVLYNNGGYMPVDYPTFIRQEVTRWPGAVPVAEDWLLHQLFSRFTAACSCCEDAPATLAALRLRGFKIGVVTNGSPSMQGRKLDHSGLLPYIDTVVIGGGEPMAKPDHRIFLRAAARLGVNPCRCLFVGDHPANDLQGSALAGMKPVHILLEGCPPVPGAIPENALSVTSLSQLLEFPCLSSPSEEG